MGAGPAPRQDAAPVRQRNAHHGLETQRVVPGYGLGPEAAQERGTVRYEDGALLAHGQGAGEGGIPLQMVDGAFHRPYVLRVDHAPQLSAVCQEQAHERGLGRPLEQVAQAPGQIREIAGVGELDGRAQKEAGVVAVPLDQLRGDPQPQLHRAGRGQILKIAQLVRRPLARLVIDGAERSEDMPVRVGERHTGVRDHPEVGDGEAVAGAGRRPGVAEDQRLAVRDDVLAEGVARQGVSRRAAQSPDNPTIPGNTCRSASSSDESKGHRERAERA
ncbi:hypothetical protein SCALM49S_09853 [Streptomyces californicus]